MIKIKSNFMYQSLLMNINQQIIYNKRHEKLNYTKGGQDLTNRDYRLFCSTCIINDY